MVGIQLIDQHTQTFPFPKNPVAGTRDTAQNLKKYECCPELKRCFLTWIQRGLSRFEIVIKAIGVWDTVGKTRSTPTID